MGVFNVKGRHWVNGGWLGEKLVHREVGLVRKNGGGANTGT